jgi:hypothetical protein
MIHIGAWSILPAAILGFLVGGLWYGPIFGKAWMAARGFTAESAKAGANMALIFGLTFVLNLFSSAVLFHVFEHIGVTGIHLALMVAGGAALGFIIPAIGVNYLFSRMTLKLFLIDAGYWLVIYLAMGLALLYLR